MKKYIFIILFGVLLLSSIFAQDIITKIDSSQIKVKISEITSDAIKYRNFDQQDGPIRNIFINQVYKVKYENGSEEIFTDIEKPKIEKPRTEERIYKSEQVETEKSKYQHANYIMVGIGYGNSYGGLGAKFQMRFGGTLGIGFHVGAGYLPAGLATDGKMDGAFLYSAGFKFFFYKPLYIDFQFGVFGVEKYEISTYYNGYYSDYSYFHYDRTEPLFGPSALVGGDFLFGKHFGFNGAVGASYNINDKKLFKTDFYFALDLGFVFRF